MKKMPLEQLVEKYIGTLQHFIEDGGWDIRVVSPKNNEHYFTSKTEANDLIANTGGFLVRKGDRLGMKGKPSLDLLALYWKKRCKEEIKESDRLYSIIAEAHRKA